MKLNHVSTFLGEGQSAIIYNHSSFIKGNKILLDRETISFSDFTL